MQKNKKINIAIDGYSACGKTTLAKQLAHHFSYILVDTGAMYRAITWYALTQNFSFQALSPEEIQKKLTEINIDFIEETNALTVNGQILTQELRSIEVSNHVSFVSTLPLVREKLLFLQKKMAEKTGVVMEGRDIGTTVMPKAQVKLFVTASLEKRVERRYNEIGQDISKDWVRQNLLERDRQDTERSYSPLVQAQDAVLLDNTNLTLNEQFEMTLALIRCRL